MSDNTDIFTIREKIPPAFGTRKTCDLMIQNHIIPRKLKFSGHFGLKSTLMKEINQN